MTADRPRPAPVEAGATRAPPRVAVLIPTIGRPSLGRAVRSALAQTFEDLVVVVGVDGPESLLEGAQLPPDDRLRFVSGPAHQGGNQARMAAARATRSELVALLDDDDWWAPTKLAAQVRAFDALRARGFGHGLVACRSTEWSPEGHRLRTTPRRAPGPGESMADYLFTRREVRPGGAAVGASMLLFDRALLEVEPLVEGLALHEDWDWVLRATGRPGTGFCMLPDTLVNYTRQPGGMSSWPQAQWATSLDWVMHRAPGLGPRQRGDALLCTTATLALQGHDWAGAAQVVRTVIASRARAGLPAWVYVAALAGRQGAKDVMAARRKRAPVAR